MVFPNSPEKRFIREKIILIREFREKYSLDILLKILKLNKSTFYYAEKHFDKKEKDNQELEHEILEIFEENYRHYGRPRITLELQRRGFNVNHKKVQKLMTKMGIKATPKRRKYNSYHGDVGRIAPNVLARDFGTTGPYQKLGTDITQFITPFGKLYLSPIIDFHTREILAFDLSKNPDMHQIKRMMRNLEEKHGDKLLGAIIHSDQGYQYQHPLYRKMVTDLGMVQSMSRKGNCLDNSPTENFFGRMKTEMYYPKEYDFDSLEDVEQEIIRYIDYYNNERLVWKIQKPPTKYRESFYLNV